MGVRLGGQALFLLSDKLAEVADESLAAARQLVDRTRGHDDLTHRLLSKLARQLAARESDLEGALA
jgi:hypothetical protein